MPYTLPPWQFADQWMEALEDFRKASGMLTISVCMTNESGDVTYVVGPDPDPEEEDA